MLAEQFGHAGFLAEALQAARGADGEEGARDGAEDAQIPGVVGETLAGKPRIADHHDADADNEQHQRTADADHHFARGAAAERFARNVAERLEDQERERNGGRDHEHRGGPAAGLWRSWHVLYWCLRRRVGHGQPTRPGCAQAGHEYGERHPEQRDPAPGRVEDGGGRDRHGRDEREPVACRNRERQRRRRGTALVRLRAAGDGAQERRQQRERGRRRSREPGDKPTQRRQARRAGPTPRSYFSGEPAGGAGCFRKPGDKACGDNHQSGRSDRLRKARAEGFADKGGGEAGREPEGGGDHDDRQKRVQQPRLGQRNQGDEGGKEQKRLDERHAGHCGGVTLAFALRAQGFPGIHWRRSF